MLMRKIKYGLCAVIAATLLIGAGCTPKPPVPTNQEPAPQAAAPAPKSGIEEPVPPPKEEMVCDKPLTEEPTDALVKTVIDGDTVDLADGTRIRVVGIDTPETKDPRKPVQCFGTEASAQMKKLVEGKMVHLEINPGDTVDKYCRQLRYLSLANMDVGAELIRSGYAFAYRPYPHVRMDQYVQLEAEAKAAKRGLWASDTCAGDASTGVLQDTDTPTSEEVSAPNPTPTTTPTSVQPTTPAATCTCPTKDLDCSDFSSRAAAQAVYDCCMAVKKADVHRLDGNDNDGLACESL